MPWRGLVFIPKELVVSLKDRPQLNISVWHIWTPVIKRKSLYPRYSGLKLIGWPGAVKPGTWHYRLAPARCKPIHRMQYLRPVWRVTSGTCPVQPAGHRRETDVKSVMIALDATGASGYRKWSGEPQSPAKGDFL